MGINLNKSRFEDIKKAVKDRNTSSFDDRHVKMEIGKTYKFRLIAPGLLEDDKTGNKMFPDIPDYFIEKYVHSVKDASDKWKVVTCPTTHLAKSGFNKCPICKNNSDLYNSGSAEDKELYKKFQRRFYGYALVYVVNDPTKPENKGKMKILQFGVNVNKFLNKQIFGIVSKAKGKEEGETDGKEKEDESADIVGFDAFQIENGYDLIIEVTQNGEWPKYDCSFARKATTITIDSEKLEAEVKALNFDKELTKSSDEELASFFNTYVLEYGKTETSDADVEIGRAAPAATASSTPAVPASQTTLNVPAAPVSTPAATPAPAANTQPVTDDADIRALLEEIDGDLK
jgi:hypothetical protein